MYSNAQLQIPYVFSVRSLGDHVPKFLCIYSNHTFVSTFSHLNIDSHHSTKTLKGGRRTIIGSCVLILTSVILFHHILKFHYRYIITVPTSKVLQVRSILSFSFVSTILHPTLLPFVVSRVVLFLFSSPLFLPFTTHGFISDI